MIWILRVILIAGISHFMATVLPWWGVMVAAFFVCFIVSKGNGFAALSAGFMAVGGLWCVQAYMIDVGTGSILTDKIALLLGLNHSYWVIGITALVGGIAGGAGALFGHHARDLFKNKRKSYY